MARFGPAGNSESFGKMGYKKNTQIPIYLEKMGLTAYEYQCGRGVKISCQAAEEFGKVAKEYGIQLSLHAPYYISLSSLEEEKRQSSVQYILQSAEAINWMGGNRVIVHCGSCAKISREQALQLAKDTVRNALQELDCQGLGKIRLCIETMGKVNQLGTMEEVAEICTIDERLLPCIDFGHLNARTQGGLKTYDDYKKIFDIVENRLGESRLREFHAHFSKIEYTSGGERCHLTFSDVTYGPDFEPIAELTAKKLCHPTFICESAGTQAEDAQAMKDIYKNIIEKSEGDYCHD